MNRFHLNAKIRSQIRMPISSADFLEKTFTERFIVLQTESNGGYGKSLLLFVLSLLLLQICRGFAVVILPAFEECKKRWGHILLIPNRHSSFSSLFFPGFHD